MPSLGSDRADAVVRALFLTPAGRSDPYPHYHELRDAAPVHRSFMGMWLVSRYDDCSAMLRDPRFGKNFQRQMENQIGANWREHPSLLRGERSMLNLEGPEHTRLRSRVVKRFNRRRIAALRASIEAAVAELLEPFAEAGGGDILDAVAFPLPVTVIGELLGVPKADRPQFRDWVRDLTAVLEMKPSAEQLASADAASQRIERYFADLIQEKRRRPQDDLLSRLADTDDEDDGLSDQELVTLASLLFGAGFETTTNLIGNGLLALLHHPGEMARLRDEPALFATLPDELLRFDGTAQLVNRFTNAEVELAGVKIPAGESVFALLGAGNHDPAEFENPDRVDLGRPRFRPLSFGGGVHFCLGAQLARAEIEVTFRSLFERFDEIELSGAPPRFRDRLTLRGLESLEVSCRAAASPRHIEIVALPEPPATPAARAVTEPSAAGGVLGARPTPGSAADLRWRNALRTRVETDADTGADAWVQSGSDLAATIVLLARAELFRHCTADEISHLAATAYPVSFEAGERLCVEGEEALECYVIAEGEATVTIAGDEIRRVGENDVVGERGLLEDRSRTATVTAKGHMNTWAISRQRFLSLVEANPSVREAMHAYMRERYER
jgi:cytochrome P450